MRAAGEQLPARLLISLAAIALTGAVAASILGWPPREASTSLIGGELSVQRTSARLAGGELAVSLVAGGDVSGPVRAWYFLARPGEAEPWESFEYRSAVRELHMEAGRPLVLAWHERPLVRDGRYEVTVWLHRLRDGEWVHAAGGPYDFGEIVVSGEGVDFRELHGGAAAHIGRPEREATGAALLLPVVPAETTTGVAVAWEFHSRRGEVRSSSSGGAAEVREPASLRIPLPDTSAGDLDLVVTATPIGDSDVPGQVAYYYGVFARPGPVDGEPRLSPR